MAKQLKPKLTPLPCPFCGSKPKLAPQDPARDGNAWGEVYCDARKCYVNPRCKDGARINDERGTGAYMDMAIRRWNKRFITRESATARGGDATGHQIIERALAKAVKGDHNNSPPCLSPDEGIAFQAGLAAGYLHALEMIPLPDGTYSRPEPTTQEPSA